MDLRPLLEILSDRSFHSGEQIGQMLSISRTAVWKKIEKLREMGIKIHSVTGKGYRIPESVNLLNRQIILRNLEPDATRWQSRLYISFSTRSTNIDAMNGAQSGIDFAVYIAEHQSEGRGRRGREWQSPVGSNIYLSMVVSFQSGIAALEGLSLAVAVMVVRALQKSGYSGFGLKWPNDILLEGKKLAGILLEVTGDVAGPCKVVVGVGINTQLPMACRLKIEQPVADLAESFVLPPDRNLIAASLIRALSDGITQFEIAGFSAFREDWEAMDQYLGKQVQIGSGPTLVEGVNRGVDLRGALRLETKEGIRVFNGGELAPTVRSN